MVIKQAIYKKKCKNKEGLFHFTQSCSDTTVQYTSRVDLIWYVPSAPFVTPWATPAPFPMGLIYLLFFEGARGGGGGGLIIIRTLIIMAILLLILLLISRIMVCSGPTPTSLRLKMWSTRCKRYDASAKGSMKCTWMYTRGQWDVRFSKVTTILFMIVFPNSSSFDLSLRFSRSSPDPAIVAGLDAIWSQIYKPNSSKFTFWGICAVLCPVPCNRGVCGMLCPVPCNRGVCAMLLSTPFIGVKFSFTFYPQAAPRSQWISAGALNIYLMQYFVHFYLQAAPRSQRWWNKCSRAPSWCARTRLWGQCFTPIMTISSKKG